MIIIEVEQKGLLSPKSSEYFPKYEMAAHVKSQSQGGHNTRIFFVSLAYIKK